MMALFFTAKVGKTQCNEKNRCPFNPCMGERDIRYKFADFCRVSLLPVPFFIKNYGQ